MEALDAKVVLRRFLGLTPTPACGEIIEAKSTPFFHTNNHQVMSSLLEQSLAKAETSSKLRPTIPYCNSSNTRSTLRVTLAS